MAIALTKIKREREERPSIADMKEYVLSVAAEASKSNVLGVTIELNSGRYTFNEPIVFSAEENPELEHVRLTIRAKDHMRIRR